MFTPPFEILVPFYFTLPIHSHNIIKFSPHRQLVTGVKFRSKNQECVGQLLRSFVRPERGSLKQNVHSFLNLIFQVIKDHILSH